METGLYVRVRSWDGGTDRRQTFELVLGAVVDIIRR